MSSKSQAERQSEISLRKRATYTARRLGLGTVSALRQLFVLTLMVLGNLIAVTGLIATVGTFVFPLGTIAVLGLTYLASHFLVDVAAGYGISVTAWQAAIALCTLPVLSLFGEELTMAIKYLQRPSDPIFIGPLDYTPDDEDHTTDTLGLVDRDPDPYWEDEGADTRSASTDSTDQSQDSRSQSMQSTGGDQPTKSSSDSRREPSVDVTKKSSTTEKEQKVRREKIRNSEYVNSEESDTSDESDEDTVTSEYVTGTPEMDFDDVGGMSELKDTLYDRVIDPLQYAEEYKEYGLSVENGFLLYGPPGTGKTYISKALAGEMGINYIEASGADIKSKNLNESAENVQQIFEEARAHQPCLIFVDEIDALTPDRSGGNQHEDQKQTTNQFLDEISQIHDRDEEIVLVGATNKPDRIDDAMLRSGRLSNKIEVPYPDKEARIAVFKAQIDAPRNPDIDYEWVGEISKGLSAADMERVATESARAAFKRRGKVQEDDIEEAVEHVREERETTD